MCELDVHSPSTTESALLASQSVDVRIIVAHRPYWCKVEGCKKRYKNLNGLKYHANVAHPTLDFGEEVKGAHGSHAGHTRQEEQPQQPQQQQQQQQQEEEEEEEEE